MASPVYAKIKLPDITNLGRCIEQIIHLGVVYQTLDSVSFSHARSFDMVFPHQPEWVGSGCLRTDPTDGNVRRYTNPNTHFHAYRCASANPYTNTAPSDPCADPHAHCHRCANQHTNAHRGALHPIRRSHNHSRRAHRSSIEGNFVSQHGV